MTALNNTIFVTQRNWSLNEIEEALKVGREAFVSCYGQPTENSPTAYKELANIDKALTQLAALREPKSVWVTVYNEGDDTIVVQLNDHEIIRTYHVSGETEINHSFNCTDLIYPAAQTTEKPDEC
jgi:hypothetical protein